ncbi:MAG TPA: redoxin domain-containing protein [Actinomycetota bacterium]|nr:redoxin domain-containing protein [Actinomycetota bacterium]
MDTDLIDAGPSPTRRLHFEGLRGVDGIGYSVDSFDHMPILAVVVTGNACPTAKAWDAELVKLQRDYLRYGVQLVMVNPNNQYLSPQDAFDRMIKRAEAAGYNFPYLKDEGGVLARRLGAFVTPQVFLFDGDRALRYTGRIADSRRPAAVMRYDLKKAIDDLVAGREVEVPETDPFGCALVL